MPPLGFVERVGPGGTTIWRRDNGSTALLDAALFPRLFAVVNMVNTVHLSAEVKRIPLDTVLYDRNVGTLIRVGKTVVVELRMICKGPRARIRVCA